MTKDVREQIAQKLTVLYKWAALCERQGYYDPEEAQEALHEDADEIIALLKENGYVRLADDQTLPTTAERPQKITFDPPNYLAGLCDGQTDMLKAGWKKVVE